MGDLLMKRAAILSDCGRYRYSLTREWDGAKSKAVFVMLNPSTADAEVDDATIRKCCGFAQRWGMGGITVVNLFAFRATQPKDMRAANDPVGTMNDSIITEACRDRIVTCAWGAHGSYRDRDRAVMALLKNVGATSHVLKLTKDGLPQHPLYIPYDIYPVEYAGRP